MFTVKDGKARRNTNQQQQQRTWRLIFSYTEMIPITDSRSRMWRCSLAIGLLSFFSFSLSLSFVCLYDCFFLSFFLREYLALFLSLLLCCGVVVVSRPFWYYKDARARHKVMEGMQRSQKRVHKSTKAPKTVLRTRHPVTTPLYCPRSFSPVLVIPGKHQKVPSRHHHVTLSLSFSLSRSLALSHTHTHTLSLSLSLSPYGISLQPPNNYNYPLSTQTTDDAKYYTVFLGWLLYIAKNATLKFLNAF